MVYLEQAARFSIGVAMAPAARQTLRRAPLRLMSENMVIRMEVSIEKDIGLKRMLEVIRKSRAGKECLFISKGFKAYLMMHCTYLLFAKSQMKHANK